MTLWKRNNKNQTAPFHVTDDLDFYMIAARKEHLSGFFLFPKLVLSEHQILTSGDQQEKRGFQVYAGWDLPQNRQAQKTKAWQTEYFTNLTNIENMKHQKFSSIMIRRVNA